MGRRGGGPEELLLTKFDYNRRELLESVGRAAQGISASYDAKAEAAALAESLQRSVAQAAIVEISAVGLGALLVKLLAASLADVTGILAAGALATLGLYIIPYKRNQAKRQLESRINDLRAQLSTTLTAQFERELERSLTRVRERDPPVYAIRRDAAGGTDGAGDESPRHGREDARSRTAD